MDSETSAIDLLHRAEADLHIFEPQIDGLSFWPVVRFRAWQMLSGVVPDPFGGSVWGRVRHQPGELARLLYAVWGLVQRRRLRKRRFDFISFSSEAYRSVKRDDGWWDVYLDDITTHPLLAGRVLRCEMRSRVLPLLRTVAPRHLFTDAQLVDQVLGGLCGSDDHAVAQAHRVCEILCEKMSAGGRPITSDERASFLWFCVQRSKMFRRALRWYGRLFAEVAPRAVAIVDAYNLHGIVGAAVQASIPVVEFQHGAFDRNHAGYSWPACAREVRTQLPIPHCFATYGDYWSAPLWRGGFWSTAEVVSVGSARLDWVRSGMPRVTGASEKIRIIYTSQHPTRSLAIPLWREFIQRADRAGLPFELIIKVHRMERPVIGEYRRLTRLSPGVKVLEPYAGDTLSLIAKSDVHVSGWSTCHFEAIGLGVPTIVQRFPGVDLTEALRPFPEVYHAGDAAELLVVIHRLHAQRSRRVPKRAPQVDALFKPNAVEHAAALLHAYAPR